MRNDLKRAELIAVPLTARFLVLVFGGLVAAGLPLVVGAMSVSGTFFILWLMTRSPISRSSRSTSSPRWGWGWPSTTRSSWCRGSARSWLPATSPTEAVVRTVATAGRTVAVSGLTVAVSLSALLVFPLYFLRISPTPASA